MWHEARRSEKKVHDMMDAARKRAQRRAVYLAKRRGDPQQSIQLVGFRCRTYRDDALYQATQDQQGLIPWNGKQDVLIDRFDGRALLDFIRDSSHRRTPEKSEEEEELEEFVNFVRYWDLVKHRGKGCRSNLPQPSASKGSYSKVGFSYDGNGKEETHISEDDDGEDFNSDDSNNEGMEIIAKEYGVKRSRSRSRSYSPSYSRRYSRIIHFDDIHRSKPRTPKIEYITEFGSSGEADEPRLEGFSPPRSPTSQVDMLNRSEHWTFNSCQDRLDSLFSVQHISHIVV